MDTGLALQEFLEFTVSGLTAMPERASVRHEVAGDRHVYRILLDESDVGRLIGRNGYTISAIRSLVNAAAIRDGVRVSIKIHALDEDGGPGREVG